MTTAYADWSIILSAAVTSTALLSIQSSPAHSCACCPEPGARYSGEISLDSVDGFVRSELHRLQLAGRANLYVTACNLDCVIGIRDPQYSYDASLDRDGDRWHLKFGDKDNPDGAISFTVPSQAFEFKVDTAPDPDVVMPELYKELRLQVMVTGTGIFADGLAQQTVASFILQGAGYACMDAENYTHWRFAVHTGAADFVFFGWLAPPI